MPPTLLALSLLRTDGGTQMRAEIKNALFLEYRDHWKAGVEFPPVDVFYDGTTYWLADGFHRFYGAREAAKKTILCNVHNGSQREAILFAVGANQANGERRTNQDKRKAVMALLNDEEWVKWSDVLVAEKAGVSQQLVSGIRNELTKIVSSPAAKAKEEPRKGKDGKSRKPPKPKPAATPTQAGETEGKPLPPKPNAPPPAPPPPKPPAEQSNFDVMVKAWQRASGSERKQFKAWLSDWEEDNP